MRLLLLGGTKFLGRHVVEAALARDHEVTIFTRGNLAHPWGDMVTALVGDRDPAQGSMAALQQGEWDAVIDTSGYLPRVVRAGTALLRGRVGHYLFVSSISVYADVSHAGVAEEAPLLQLDDPDSEEMPAQYGALKAACEAVVQESFGAAALVVRPGLIIGPHDPTDRFSYWPARFLAPHLLGERAANAVVPEPPERPLQFIDVRDLALWMVQLVEHNMHGVFNATSTPGRHTMGSLIALLQDLAAQRGTGVTARWISEAQLEAAGVVPWTGLPLWIPTSDPSSAGFDKVSTALADATGLQHRPLATTVADTLAWLLQRDNAACWKAVLSSQQEHALLAP